MRPAVIGVQVRWAVCSLALLGIALLVLAAPAHAAFPGKNGKIAFTRLTNDGGDFDIWTMNPDGSGQVRLTTSPGTDTDAVWSPDGKKLVFTSERDGNREIYVMNADGSGQTRLTSDAAFDYLASWSPDGTKIVFTNGRSGHDEIYTMNADGTGLTQITSTPPIDPQDPIVNFEAVWSPDGNKIAFVSTRDGNYEIYVMNADGSGISRLTNSGGDDWSPAWSPNGSRILFVSSRAGGYYLWTMNPDGSDPTQITSGSNSARAPAWSPDERQFAYTHVAPCCGGTGADFEIYTSNADGTNPTDVTNSPLSEDLPDWQPLPINSYPRPKGATPFQTYLTVAYKPCPVGANNRQHGAPLAVDSCSPPVQSSDYLTVGTMDANGQPSKAVGSVRYDVKPGNPATSADEADVKLTVSLKDVRNKSDLSDYTGELAATATRRITDKNNTPSPDGGTGAATTQDFPFSATVPCAATTSDTTIGSTCELFTTADALVPGQVTENVRSIWQLAQVQVFDGGSDQDADTTADNTLFMDEGVFVP